MNRDADIAVPNEAAVAAETRSLPSRRRRRFPWAPYGLLAPVILALGAVLGYPAYKLVTLSFQKYGLFELIQKKGEWLGLRNYASVLHDSVFWDTVVRTVVFTIANVGLTIVLGTLIALLLVRISTVVRIMLTTGCRSSSRCRSSTG
jgi:N,N'-diacetylchitobiose transport system permease protein